MQQELSKIINPENLLFKGEEAHITDAKISLQEKICEVTIEGVKWFDRRDKKQLSLYNFIYGLNHNLSCAKDAYDQDVSLKIRLKLSNWKQICRLLLQGDEVQETEISNVDIEPLSLEVIHGKWLIGFIVECKKLDSDESFILYLGDLDWDCSIVQDDAIELLEAAKSNVIAKIRKLLITVDPNTSVYVDRDYYIDTRVPLIEAVRAKHFPLVKFLCESGADVNLCEIGTGNTALNAALRNGKDSDYEVAKYLIENGTDLDIEAAWGVWPLGSAVFNNDFALVKYLIDKGADINKICEYHDENETRSTALGIAVMEQNIPMIKLLIQLGANPNADSLCYDTPLQEAEELGNTTICQLLIEAGGHP